jgi:hypothetical protein
MPESSLRPALAFFAKQYGRARRSLSTAATPAIKRALGTRRKKIIAIGLMGAILVGGVGTAVGVFNARESAAAEVRAADAVEAAKAEKVAAEELDAERMKSGEALTAGAAFAVEARDYADAGDLKLLEDALAVARELLSTGSAAEVYDSRLTVRLAVARVGERPVPYTWSVTCKDTEYVEIAFDTYSGAWTSPRTLRSCAGGSMAGDFLTDAQDAVLASGAIQSQDKLAGLYGLCADLGFSSYRSLTAFSESQITELEAVLTLCPDQPAAGDLTAKIAASRQATADEAAGIRFGAGIRRVGESVQPGTYVSEGNFDSCYWERTAADGGIIDNFVTLGALRVEVTIRASDFSFNSTGCGTWHRP